MSQRGRKARSEGLWRNHQRRMGRAHAKAGVPGRTANQHYQRGYREGTKEREAGRMGHMPAAERRLLISDAIPQIRHVLDPLGDWTQNCHAASIKLVKSGVLPHARVARGWCFKVPSQHSWVVVGDDCYDPEAPIVDPTLWDHHDDIGTVWVGTLQNGLHSPHGAGTIWEWGHPKAPTGPIVKLTPRKSFSNDALLFLDILGPLDEKGWRELAHAPTEEWPATEILPAINDSFDSEWVPVDIIGMLTDRNPGGLYLADGNVTEIA